MTTPKNQRRHLLSHARRRFPSGLGGLAPFDAWSRRWETDETWTSQRSSIEPYTKEDMFFDQMEQLPSAEKVSRIVLLLRNPELRSVAEGVINDVSTACRQRDTLEVAKAVNSWIATAEEVIGSRRTLRFIEAARLNRR